MESPRLVEERDSKRFGRRGGKPQIQGQKRRETGSYQHVKTAGQGAGC